MWSILSEAASRTVLYTTLTYNVCAWALTSRDWYVPDECSFVVVREPLRATVLGLWATVLWATVLLILCDQVQLHRQQRDSGGSPLRFLKGKTHPRGKCK